MKQVIIISLMLIISVAAEVRAQGDPKTGQMIQGAGSSIGALMSGIVAIEHLTKCYTSKMAGNTDLLECAMGGLAGTATVMQLGISGYSFATAGSLESDKETNSKDLFSSEKSLPTDEDFNHLEPSEPTASFVLRDDVLKNMGKIKAQLKNLKDQGIITDEIIANPEKFLTPEQLAAFNAEKGNLMGGIEDDSDSSSQALEALLEDSASGSSESEGSQTESFQTASLTSGFDSLFDSLDLEGLLGLKEKGIQNSAPGYYGNVPLKSLRPDSSMSLFERVSLKIRREMSRKPLASGHYNTQGAKSEI